MGGSHKPLRIGILSYRSDPRVGGQGVYIDYLSRALVATGAQVTIISGPPYPQLDVRVKLVKLPSLDLYAQPHQGHYALRPRHLLSPTDTYEYFGHMSGKFVEPYTFGQRAYAYLKRHKDAFDVILDNQTLAQGVLRSHQRLGLPLVTMIHHPITQDRRLAIDAATDWKHRWLARRWYAFHRMQIRVARKLPIFTCPSEHAKADIIAAFGLDSARLKAIPLGVDQAAFCPHPHLQRSTHRIITTASADTPLKGLHILVQAYHQLLRTHPDAELLVIGKLRDGQARQWIERLGLEQKIQFRSGLRREELAAAFATASLAVTPSLYEGFGLPAAEAMSCGTPVIVTDGGALPEVAGDAGIVVARNDVGTLTEAMSQLLASPRRRAKIGAACLQRARAEFNWQTIAPKYLALFRQAMAVPC